MKVSMKIYASSLSKLLIFLMIALVSINTGCKNKQKEAEKKAAAERAAKIAQAKTDLQALLADNSKSPEELERDLARIKAMGLNDPEVNALIRQVEEKINKKKAEIAEAKRKAEEEERRRREEEERQKPAKLSLNDYFTRIISASSANEANNYINDALKLFASPDTPVLIAIGVFGGEKDYDKPTTIRKYLEYLKDQKKNLNNIDNIVYDNNGKIKELELMRKK
jgi:small-conductance mechanosensitive channel